MALLFADSFDHYSQAQILRKWSNQTIGAGGGISASAGRNGTAGYGFISAVSTADGLGRSVPSNPSRMLAGFAIQVQALPGTSRAFCAFTESGGCHVYVVMRTDGKFEAFRPPATSLGVSSIGVNSLQYNYFEIDTKIDSTTGAIEIRLNATPALVLNNINTRNGGAGVITNAWIAGCGGTVTGVLGLTSNFDDLYFLDTAGGTNTFLGDVRVQAILPNGAGNYTQWTPLSGANWQNVDENPCTDDTDYNSSSTAAQKDSFVFPDITPSAGTVYAVAVNLMMRKDDAGTRTVRALARLSSTDSFGSDINVGGSYANYQSILETKPGGGSWSVADVNNSEFGYDLVA
jgi:hypothetical protein